MPDLLIGILVTIGLAWASWVSLTLIKLSKSNGEHEAVRLNNSQSVDELKKAFTEMESRVTDSLNNINLRQDRFMQTEIETLKSLIDK